ncbi:MAG: HAD hydrolase family protein [Planctomycetota bacterium]
MPTADPARVRMIVFDVDGVFTDGRIYLDADGRESKAFHTRDGFGVRMAREAGLVTAVLSARTAGAVDHRMKQLQIDHVLQGVDRKRDGIATLAERTGVDPADMAYLGDDILDLNAMQVVGYPMAVADASAETRAAAAYVTQLPGGRGAIRDAVEHVLKAQGKWDALVAQYVSR